MTTPERLILSACAQLLAGVPALPFYAIEEHVAMSGHCIDGADLFDLCLDRLAVSNAPGWL